MRVVPPAQLNLLYEAVGEPFVSTCFEERLGGDKWRDYHFWELAPLEAAKRLPVHEPVGFRKLAFNETAYIRSGQFAGRSMTVTVFHKEEAALVPSKLQPYFIASVWESFIKETFGASHHIKIGTPPGTLEEGRKSLNFFCPAEVKQDSFGWSAYVNWEMLFSPKSEAIRKATLAAMEDHVGPSRRRWALTGNADDENFVKNFERGAAWLGDTRFNDLVWLLENLPWKKRPWGL